MQRTGRQGLYTLCWFLGYQKGEDDKPLVGYEEPGAHWYYIFEWPPLTSTMKRANILLNLDENHGNL